MHFAERRKHRSITGSWIVITIIRFVRFTDVVLGTGLVVVGIRLQTEVDVLSIVNSLSHVRGRTRGRTLNQLQTVNECIDGVNQTFVLRNGRLGSRSPHPEANVVTKLTEVVQLTVVERVQHGLSTGGSISLGTDLGLSRTNFMSWGSVEHELTDITIDGTTSVDRITGLVQHQIAISITLVNRQLGLQQVEVNRNTRLLSTSGDQALIHRFVGVGSNSFHHQRSCVGGVLATIIERFRTVNIDGVGRFQKKSFCWTALSQEHKVRSVNRECFPFRVHPAR